MKHHPNGSLKNIMVFTALANIMLYINMAFFFRLGAYISLQFLSVTSKSYF